VLNSRLGGELRFDWVLVRKYASPEPTWGAWGSSEGNGGLKEKTANMAAKMLAAKMLAENLI